MSQNTLKVHDLNEDAEFDENGVEAFDEKALSEEEPSDNDLAEEELLSQGATQRVLDATQLYLGEIGYSPLLTAEEEVYFARRALRGDVASRRRMIESNLRLVVKIARRYGNRGLALLDILADEKENGPEDTTQDDDMKQSIVKWLFELNAKQREVLARRFGLLGYEAATLEDVGREIGLTRERVRQIQVEGLRRLREILQTQGLNIEALFRE
ncbi:TPA: hypothetical protein G9F85_003020 [Salmonella enterica]|uniref:RNA polymerase sigma-70 domain-containing protein n=1 Tax=Salmonella enterica TaxID=28901 RepID=A0A754VW10_SALER|nr:sigma factor-like helix-turn-helix DNA-binding protein [Salmonella enterica]EDK2631606.1 hypothetical protein [Salmonella enterica subsp. enterica serovar Enteritidis]EIZ3062799.1 hypothetical protein [Salmonella enterica subsp. enterica serovar Heidelberg]HAT0929081.1 hypothetical protein [Salmonella enterica subsp. enterica serovar Typhimurium]HCK5767188.1 hypothetical protein [Salmonella enterica subsp. enterica serovar Typhi str. CT18]HDW6407727.1 hypothetical protein [Salmonella enteri